MIRPTILFIYRLHKQGMRKQQPHLPAVTPACHHRIISAVTVRPSPEPPPWHRELPFEKILADVPFVRNQFAIDKFDKILVFQWFLSSTSPGVIM